MADHHAHLCRRPEAALRTAADWSGEAVAVAKHAVAALSGVALSGAARAAAARAAAHLRVGCRAP